VSTRQEVEQFKVTLSRPKSEVIVEGKEQLARFIESAKASGTEAAITRRTVTVETGDWLPYVPAEAS
jgi:hypothetical protein